MGLMTALDVYPLCLGGNAFGWTTDLDQSSLVLDEYVEAGGNFIDTADSYSAWVPGNSGGESEEILGTWMARRGCRDQVLIATKVGMLEGRKGLAPGIVKAAAEDSLRRLQTDRIDVYYAHKEDLEVPVEESVQAFADLQREGKIVHVGLSNHSAARLQEWVEAADRLGVPRPVALQPHYNLLAREEFETELRPLATRYGLAVMPYFSLASGLLTGKYDPDQPITGARAERVRRYLGPRTPGVLRALREIGDEHNVEPAAVAIAWLLHQQTITAPIASASSPEQLGPLFEGVSIVLQVDELARLEQD